MKYLAVIFSLFIFSLSVGSIVEVFDVHSEAVCCIDLCDDETEKDEDNCTEVCNPFSSCHCCFGFSVPSTLSFNGIWADIFCELPSIYSSLLNTTPTSIWQPPKQA